MKQQDYYLATSLIFLAVFVLHAFRVTNEWPAVIGGFDVPLWMSWAALIVSGSFLYFGLRLGGFIGRSSGRR
ncbi:MAG: hypothetical protein HYS74_00560 [Parcubacteria group bacterium]|nr:hypothetical protein [Parcubacteria group bacterium]